MNHQGQFKSICRCSYSTYMRLKPPLQSYLIEILKKGKEYMVVPSYKGVAITHYDIYDIDGKPLIVYMKTRVSGLSTRSYSTYFYTQKEIRDIKLNDILEPQLKLW